MSKKWNDNWYNECTIQDGNSLLQTRYGTCYDQVEFARKWFLENNYEVFTFFSKYHNHSFLIYNSSVV